MSTRRETKAFPIAHVKAVDVDAGTFEAFVAVFGNVDYHGDRIAADAFDASLARWKASGDPVPIIFSHQWHDLGAYLGEADPGGIEAVPPGDARLPEAIRELGGLLVKGTIDTDEDEGRKALKLLKRRVVREFSFAYDVLDEVRGSDGFNDLLEVDLLELGPTLKGANPLTQLVSAKAASDPAVADALAVLRKAITDADPTPPAPPPAKRKAWVTPDGTIERQLEAVRGELVAEALARHGEELYTVSVEGTWADRVLFYVELWSEPVGGGVYFEAGYSVDDAGAAVVEEWTAVDFQVSVVPRAAAAGDRFQRKDVARVEVVAELTEPVEDPTELPAVDELEAKSSTPALILASVEADLLDL